MISNWIIVITIKEWNQFLKIKILENIDAPKISDGDLVCFYVVGTSSIKGIGKKFNGSIHLEKIGDLNYFGISDRLEFVKDKENVVKYLKNFHGIANLGKPFSSTDMEVIASEVTPLAARTEGAVEKQIELKDTLLKPGSAYETMFNLEVSSEKLCFKRAKQDFEKLAKRKNTGSQNAPALEREKGRSSKTESVV